MGLDVNCFLITSVKALEAVEMEDELEDITGAKLSRHKLYAFNVPFSMTLAELLAAEDTTELEP